MTHVFALRRPTALVLALTLSVGMVACGTETTPVVNTTPTVTGVTVTATATSLTIGQTTQAKATVTGTNTPSQTVTWSSSNTAVATVSSTGVITAVAAGSANIIATSTVSGYTTVKGQVAVTVTAPVVTAPVEYHINFQPAGAAPAGYTANSGAAYDPATGIGWVTEASSNTAAPAPLPLTANTRDRSTSANALQGRSALEYTQVNMQCGPATDGKTCSAGNQTPGAFEFKLPNGTYNVTVNVGESVTTDFNSRMNLNVEVTNFVTDFVPSSATPFQKIAKQVTVTDGSLSINAKGGVNTKLQYVDIVEVK